MGDYFARVRGYTTKDGGLTKKFGRWSNVAALYDNYTFTTSETGTEPDIELTINASGGTAPYLYSINTVDAPATYQTSNVFTGLSNGTYYVYVKDKFKTVIHQSVSVGLDPATVAFIDAVTNAGGSLTETEIAAVNFRVRSFKGLDTSYNPTAIDFWSLGIADYPFVGGTATSCKFNLFDPQDTDGAYRLSFSGSNTFSANGWQGGANGYANPHVIPGNYTNNFFGRVYDRTNVWTNGRYWFGCFDGSAVTWLSYSDTQFVYINTTSTGVIPAAPVQQTGDISCSRVAANDVRGFADGSQVDGTVTTADSAGTTNGVYLQACNGLLGFGYAQKEYGSSSFFQGLTAAQVLVLRNIDVQFQTMLSRNV